MRKAILVLVLLAAAWSAAWFALAMLVGRQVDGFIAAEARQGRDWTCPDRHVSGYPLRLTVACRDPTFAGQAMGQRVDAGVAGLAATLGITHPLRVSIALQPPFSYRSADGATVLDGTWHSLVLDLASLPEPRTMVLRGSDVVVGGRVPQEDDVGGRAARLDAKVVASPPPASPTLDLTVALDGVPVPALDAVVGNTAPVDATLAGTITQASVGEARTPAEALERWRENGGTLNVSALTLARAGARASGSGMLRLDGQHRPAGRLDASFEGLGPILARYGISGDVAALGSLIGTFFGGAHPARAAKPGSLNLPVSLGNGRLSVGPITTAVNLAPLY